jgi:hypothetical protein
MRQAGVLSMKEHLPEHNAHSPESSNGCVNVSNVAKEKYLVG